MFELVSTKFNTGLARFWHIFVHINGVLQMFSKRYWKRRFLSIRDCKFHWNYRFFSQM